MLNVAEILLTRCHHIIFTQRHNLIRMNHEPLGQDVNEPLVRENATLFLHVKTE